MNRRDFVTRLALGVAVTPAAVKAATELAPVWSRRRVGIYAQLEEAGRIAEMSPGTPDMQQLFETLYALKRERDSEPPRDYIDVIVPDRETGVKLLRMFDSMRKD